MERLGLGQGSSLALARPPSAFDDLADDPSETRVGSARGRGDPAGTGVATLPSWVRNTCWTLLGLQLVGMLVFSSVEYGRFSLTNDFANYSQAWWEIAHGHLNPFITNLGVPFWRDNAEFVFWPLSLLSAFDPHPITLLWLQDVVVVLTEFVAFAWIRKVIERADRRIPHHAGPLLALGTAVVLVANPWAYETIAFDFHFEPIAALFCVLAAYDLWSGRTRRLWLWVPLALISHVLAGTYLVGVGISGMLAGRDTRRPGAVIAGAGLVWVYVFTAVGAAGVNGEFVGSSYGYLVGRHHGSIGIFAIVVGALGHPAAVVHVAASHWLVLVSFLTVVGFIGVLSPWGLGMALVVLVPNVLDASGLFIRYAASFQSWPAMPFILVGSIILLVRLLEGGDVARRVATVTAAVWATVLAVSVWAAFPNALGSWLDVSPGAAAELAHVAPSIPPNAEVVASLAVVGRFGQRDSVYAFNRGDQTFPVSSRLVVFVFTPKTLTDGGLGSHAISAAVALVQNRLHARVLGSRSGVHAFVWTPPGGTSQITLP